MWGKKKQTAQPTAHIETDAEYWAKRDAQQDAKKAEQAQSGDGDWDGYPAPPLPAGVTEADLFGYELSAYSDAVGYHADGIQRVSPVRRK